MSATATPPPPASAPGHPDDYRMTVGEHLEELRSRLIRGLAGAFIGLLICLPFGRQMLAILIQPMLKALQAYNVNPQVYSQDVTDAFTCWLWVSVIGAAFISGPWLIYQLWQFVATGLYPHERKYVTRYVPLSVILLLTGFAFVYYIVLPLTLRFFLAFLMTMPAMFPTVHNAVAVHTTTQPTYVQAVAADPPDTDHFRLWFNTTENRLKVNLDGSIQSLPFGGNSLIAPLFTLSEYLSLVFRLMLTFGICFQMPLVVLALATLNIVTIADLRKFRRYVYFGMTVLAAAVSPGDAVTATVALLIPLIFLYEFGIFLAQMSTKRSAATPA